MDGYREKKQPVVFFIVLFVVALYSRIPTGRGSRLKPGKV